MMQDLNATKRINLLRGEYRVSGEANVVFTTILGSCVGACLRDPGAGIGGMNHFLLPEGECEQSGDNRDCLGVHLMELLVNGLMRQGALKGRLEAKVFGGARMIAGLADVGKRNADFAKRFLDREDIRIAGADLGGDRGRRLQYWPTTGRVRLNYIENGGELPTPGSAVSVFSDSGDVTLF